jgi:hypothetical protein
MAVPGSEWGGTSAGHWGFGDIAADLNAATAQLFSGNGDHRRRCHVCDGLAGTATGVYATAHFWGSNDNHDGWPVPLVGHCGRALPSMAQSTPGTS